MTVKISPNPVDSQSLQPLGPEGRSVQRRIFWLAVGFIVGLGCTAALVLTYLRHLETESGKRLIESFAQVIEEQTTRTLQATDQRLQLAALSLAQLQASGGLNENSARAFFLAQIGELPFLRAMWVLDVQGRMIFNSDVGNIGLDLGDRAYFQIYRTQPQTGFYLATPVRSRTTGNWLISAARPLKSANGTFEGVIVAAVEPPYFDKLWRSIDLGSGGSVALLNRSGILMMRSPFDDKAMGQNFQNSVLLRSYYPNSPVGSYEDVSPIDGQVRQYAYRALSSQPELVVVVGKPTELLLAPWRRLSILTLVVWAAASTAIALLSLFLNRTWQQRLRIETRSRREANRLALATQAGSIGVWDWDMTEDQWYANPTYFTMLGYEPEDGFANRAQWIERLHPEDRAIVAAKIQRAIVASEEPYHYEARLRHADGSYRWISVTGRVLERDGQGKASRLLGVRIDITERKQAEEDLKVSEAHYRELFDSNPLPTWVYDLETLAFLAVNDAAIAHYGYSRVEFLAMTIRDIRPPEDVAMLLDNVSSVRSGLSAAEYWRHRRKGGDVILVEVTAHSLTFGGRSARMVIANDVTARHEAEEKLRLSEENLSITLQSIGDAVIATDAAGLITRMNATAQRLTGWPLSEATGRPLTEVFHIVNAQTRVPSANPVQLVMQRGEVVGLANHTALLARDGREHQISDSAAPIRDQGGQIVGVVLVFSDVTEAYQVREALATTLQLLERTGEMAKVGGGEIDLRTLAVVWSQEACRIHGADPGTVLTFDQILQFYEPQARERLEAAVQAAIANGAAYDMELAAVTAQGRSIWVRAQGTTVMEDDRAIKLVGAFQDITDNKAADTALRIAASAFESQQGMYVTDEQWHILRANKAFTVITGYSAQEAVGKTPSELLSSGRHDDAFYEAMEVTLDQTDAWQGEIWDKRKSGEVFPQWVSITTVRNEEGRVTHRVHAVTDITERKAAENQIQSLAFFDPLTGLPNRRLLMDRLKQAVATGARRQNKGALLFVDLDNFKTLNDTLGHDKGDLLLQQVAQRLSTCIREGDTVARLGGDEFVVMLEDLSENELEAAAQAETVGEKIRVELNQNYLLAGYTHHSTPSIGVTLFGDPHENIEEPLKRADLAMYQAKAAGRNTQRFFDPQMQAVVTARAVLEEGLREALAREEFVLHYQGQVMGQGDGTSRLTGAEALVRWLHPQRGLVSPAEFIPLAEDTGLILLLGSWVMEAACWQLANWARRADCEHLTLAVNVSPRQFHQEDFVSQVMAVLQRTGANPRRLKLELTEGMLVSNIEDVIAKMSGLKARGVGFSLDDFGTGYSSLSHLKRLPLDQLKIDQGFVRDVLTDANDAAIAKMVIALGDSLGLAVIAEGVETGAQRDFLAGLGCHAYQGYLFSRPMPIAEFEAYAESV